MFGNLVSRLGLIVTDLLCPPFCTSCMQWLEKRSIMCASCLSLIQPIVSTKIVITPSHSMTVFGLSAYQDPIKKLVLAKITSQRLASKQLGELIWSYTPLESASFDYIVPIPLHWTRYAYRGYNQAEVIAGVLAKKSGKQVVNVLQRYRRTVFQSSLPLELRADNVKHVLRRTKKSDILLKDKHILLVDDLMTTGSTLRAAAKELLYSKPASITAVVACRAC